MENKNRCLDTAFIETTLNTSMLTEMSSELGDFDISSMNETFGNQIRCSTPVPDFNCQDDESRFDRSCLDANDAATDAKPETSNDTMMELCDGVAAMKPSQ